MRIAVDIDSRKCRSSQCIKAPDNFLNAVIPGWQDDKHSNSISPSRIIKIGCCIEFNISSAKALKKQTDINPQWVVLILINHREEI